MLVPALAAAQATPADPKGEAPQSAASEPEQRVSATPAAGEQTSEPAASPNTNETTANDPAQAAPPEATSGDEATSLTANAPPTSEQASVDLERRLADLEEKNAYLEEELEILREDQQWTQEQVDKVLPLTSRLSGYVDFGFFYVSGDGRGIRTDLGHENFPEYDGVVADSWVFMGDPLSTAINSRGDPADVNESRAVTNEQVGSDGKPSFILNNINLSLFTGVGDNLTINGMVDFVPRGRDVSVSDQVAFGDFIDVKLGYLSYRIPTSSLNLELFAGKFDSVLGIEYRTQESPQRIAVTPSLICRYTCGRPLGLKARAGFFDDRLVLNTAVTNGSHSTEGFPIYDETDSNNSKTASGRLSYEFDLAAGLEFGASGAYGAQDRQTEDDVIHWHYGFDARLDLVDFVLNAEFVQGELQGQSEPGGPPCGLAQCLEYKGAYGLMGYRVTNWLMPYARVDWRSALHQSGASFVYISDLIRPTGGLRFDLGTHVVLKAEYTLNRELAGVPEFDNDVFTTSLVGKL